MKRWAMALLLALGMAAPAQGEIRRCVREDGSIYFTDTICPRASKPAPARKPMSPAPPDSTRPALEKRPPAAPASIPPAPAAHSSSPRSKPPSAPVQAPAVDPWQRPDFPAPPPLIP